MNELISMMTRGFIQVVSHFRTNKINIKEYPETISQILLSQTVFDIVLKEIYNEQSKTPLATL